jgi:CRP/FNR family transcriptional regulator, cyclic AMP receptor protein
VSSFTAVAGNRTARGRVSPGTATTWIASRPTSLLGQLDPDDAAHFEPVLARCPTLRLEAGSRLGAARLSRASFVVVEAGVAAIATSAEHGRRATTLAIARAGDLLVPPGETEVLAALTAAVVTLLPLLVLRALLARPAAAAVIVERLADAVHDRQESLAQFGAVEHVRRVRAKLLQLARTHGRVSSDGVRLDLPLTHELIAQTTGSARETVTAAIAELQREGFLVRDGRSYRLTVAPELLDAMLARTA